MLCYSSEITMGDKNTMMDQMFVDYGIDGSKLLTKTHKLGGNLFTFVFQDVFQFISALKLICVLLFWTSNSKRFLDTIVIFPLTCDHTSVNEHLKLHADVHI